MIFLIDMDGPLADFDLHFFDRVEQRGWSMDAVYGEQTARFATEHIIDPRHRAAARRMVNSDPYWFLQLPVVDGAVDGLNELARHGEVWICTKPLEANPTCRDSKAKWLGRHFGDEWVHRLILAPDKSLVHGSVLLDDAPKLEWFGRASWQPVIFPAPFNGEGSEWGDLPRWTWGDPVEHLIDLAAGGPS